MALPQLKTWQWAVVAVVIVLLLVVLAQYLGLVQLF